MSSHIAIPKLSTAKSSDKSQPQFAPMVQPAPRERIASAAAGAASFSFGDIPVLSVERDRRYESPVPHDPAAPPWPLQATLRVGTVDDPLEREADSVADHVMRMPDPALIPSSLGSQALRRKCNACSEEEDGQTVRRNGQSGARQEESGAAKLDGGSAPAIVQDVLGSSGRPLDAATRDFFEPRFGHDFSQVRVHTDEKAASSAQAVNAQAYTVGKNIVFGAGKYAPNNREGQRLIAHELTHTVQQSGSAVQGVSKIGQPDDVHEQDSGLATVQRQTEEDTPQAEGPEEEGIEIGDQLIMMLPRWRFVTLPVTEAPFATPSAPAVLQRQALAPATSCPSRMRKVIGGKFEGGKTLDDYYPDLVGAKAWGKNDTAGPFDNGVRAGSAVQLIGEYRSPCIPTAVYTLGQTASTVRFRINGKKAMENGKPLEGTTFDDIQRSQRDQSKPPHRQYLSFAISMADPISGAPYSTLKAYEFEVNLTSSITGPDGTQSVDWGVTIEASGGRVTKNEVR